MWMYLHAGQGESVRSLSNHSIRSAEHANEDEQQQETLEPTESGTVANLNRQSLLSDGNSERCDSDYNASAESNASSHRASVGSHELEEDCQECQQRLQEVLGSPLRATEHQNRELLVFLRREEVRIFMLVCSLGLGT